MATFDEMMVRLFFDTSGLEAGAKQATDTVEKTATDMAAAANKGEKAQTGAADAIVAGLNRLAAAMEKGGDQGEKQAKRTAEGNKKVAASFEGAIRTGLTFIAVLAGARTVEEFTRKITALDASIGRLSHGMAQSPEALSGIGRAVERMGGSFDGATGGLRALSDGFQELRTTGSSALLEPLARLQALSGKAITFGRDVRQNFYSIADALHALDQKDPAQADYFARRIFGDEGLANFAKQGGAAVRAQEAESRRHGVVDPKDVKAAQDLQKAYVALSQSVVGLGTKIETALSPYLTKLLTYLDELIDKNGGEWVREFSAFLDKHKPDIEAFGNSVGNLATSAEAIAQAFGKQAPMTMALEAFAGLLTLRLLNPINLLLTALQALAAFPLTGGWLAFARIMLGAGGAAGAMNVGHTDEYGRDAGTWGGDAPERDHAGTMDDPNAHLRHRKAHTPHSALRRLYDWGKSKLGFGGGSSDGVRASGAGLSPEARALLDTLASGEAKDYNVLNGGGTFNDYSHHPGGRAAGRYQFLPTTWRDVQAATGAKDFGPEAQDQGAWWLAQHDYQKRTGRNLQSDLASKDPARIAEIGRQLSPTWVSLNGSFAGKYGRYLDRNATQANAQPSAPTATTPQPDDPDKMIAGDISGQSNLRVGTVSEPKGFIVHHTGGRGTPEGVVQTLNQRGLGVQYVMDRDGKIYRTLPDGSKGYHIKQSEINDLNNSNTQGMEVIAKDDKDVTPAQVAAGKAFLEALSKKYPGLQVFGHGEVNHQKQPTEGHAIVEAFRAGRAAPMTDPNYKPAPVPLAQRTLQGYMGRDPTPPVPAPTLGHAVMHAFALIRHAQHLTEHGDKPVPVTMDDKSLHGIERRTFGAYLHGAKKHLDMMPSASSIRHAAAWHGLGPGALENHRGLMAGASLYHHNPVTNHYDQSSDTKIATVNIHTRATDAQGMAADLEPIFDRSARAGRVNYGLG